MWKMFKYTIKTSKYRLFPKCFHHNTFHGLKVFILKQDLRKVVANDGANMQTQWNQVFT